MDLKYQIIITIITALGASSLTWWRFASKDKVDVRKVESDIRMDDANIASKRVEDDIKRLNMSLEMMAQYAVQLNKSDEMIDKLKAQIISLQTVIEDLRNLNHHLKNELGNKIDELETLLRQAEVNLEVEKKHCLEISAELNKIKNG